MRWEKLGLIALPTKRPAWMASHASVPFGEAIDGDRLRIWFSSRDAQNRSHTGWALIDLKEPNKVLELCEEPVLSPGELGCFDDSGSMLSWIADRGRTRLLYYIGWNLGVTVPFRNSIGIAVSENGAAFARLAPGPIVDRTAAEPHLVASCSVLPFEGAWRMWYLSCVRWEMHAGLPRHWYHIKYAESDDGVRWRRSGKVAIDFEGAGEYAISRPSVVHDADRWRMWYSYRGDAYRIGYAESDDGVSWTRKDDQAGIEPSASGWDSEMIEYPHVFDVAAGRFMLYNGNGYGRTGFGLARLARP
jgi:hypothetical protein